MLYNHCCIRTYHILTIPPFLLNLGDITSYPPTYKENAGIFYYNNPWVAITDIVVKGGNRAFEIYDIIAVDIDFGIDNL